MSSHIVTAEIKKFNKLAKVPQYQTPGAAAFDLHACFKTEHEVVVIYPGDTIAVPTGIGIFLCDPAFALFIHERSGLGAKGIGRRAGVVDSDYQGEIKVLLTNHTERSFEVFHGDRIAQAVIAPVYRGGFTVVDEFSAVTERGSNGFGSTGR